MFEILYKYYLKSKQEARQYIIDYKRIINNILLSVNTKVKENLKHHSI